jgi:hypothetical protein
MGIMKALVFKFFGLKSRAQKQGNAPCLCSRGTQPPNFLSLYILGTYVFYIATKKQEEERQTKRLV